MSVASSSSLSLSHSPTPLPSLSLSHTLSHIFLSHSLSPTHPHLSFVGRVSLARAALAKHIVKSHIQSYTSLVV